MSPSFHITISFSWNCLSGRTLRLSILFSGLKRSFVIRTKICISTVYVLYGSQWFGVISKDFIMCVVTCVSMEVTQRWKFVCRMLIRECLWNRHPSKGGKGFRRGRNHACTKLTPQGPLKLKVKKVLDQANSESNPMHFTQLALSFHA